MSSDSDSDDDVQMKQFLEAADTTLLNNSMFQKNDVKTPDQLETAADCKTNIVEFETKDLPRSQRHLQVDDENTGTDFNLPESMQKFMAKKLSETLKQQYVFDDATKNLNIKKIKAKHRSRVKLLKGDECFVNSYEDFEYETKGPEKKPEIKRRVVDVITETDGKPEDKFKMIVVDSNFILSGHDMNKWTKKKERKDKMFHYRLASTGVAHALEDINEFTELRRKNKWNESKIKNIKNNKY